MKKIIELIEAGDSRLLALFLFISVSVFVFGCDTSPRTEVSAQPQLHSRDMFKITPVHEFLRAMEDSIRSYKDKGDSQSVGFGVATMFLGTAHFELGDYRTAESLYFIAEAVFSRLPDMESRLIEVLTIHTALAIKQGELPLAYDLLGRSLNVLYRFGTDDAIPVIMIKLGFVKMLLAAAKYDDVVAIIEPEVERCERVLGVNDSLTCRASDLLLLTLMAKGDEQRIEAFARRIVTTRDSTQLQPLTLLADAANALGKICHGQGRNQEAIEFFLAAIRFREAAGDTTGSLYRELFFGLGLALAADGQGENAAPVFDNYLVLLREAEGDTSALYRKRTLMVADFYKRLGKSQRAIELEALVGKAPVP